MCAGGGGGGAEWWAKNVVEPLSSSGDILGGDPARREGCLGPKLVEGAVVSTPIRIGCCGGTGIDINEDRVVIEAGLCVDCGYGSVSAPGTLEDTAGGCSGTAASNTLEA